MGLGVWEGSLLILVVDEHTCLFKRTEWFHVQPFEGGETEPLEIYGKCTEMYPRNQTTRSSSLRHFLFKKIKPTDIHLLDS